MRKSCCLTLGQTSNTGDCDAQNDSWNPLYSTVQYIENYKQRECMEDWKIKVVSEHIVHLHTTCVFMSSLSSGPATSSIRMLMGFLSVRLSLVGLTMASAAIFVMSPVLREGEE